MSRLRAVLHELAGLFVDDGSLALSLVLAVGLVGAWVALLAPPPLFAALVLTAACLAALLASVWRAGRARRNRT